MGERPTAYSIGTMMAPRDGFIYGPSPRLSDMLKTDPRDVPGVPKGVVEQNMMYIFENSIPVYYWDMFSEAWRNADADILNEAAQQGKWAEPPAPVSPPLGITRNAIIDEAEELCRCVKSGRLRKEEFYEQVDNLLFHIEQLRKIQVSALKLKG